MSEMPRFRFVDLVALILVVATAAGLRGAYLWYLADQAKTEGPWLVQDKIPPLANATEIKDPRHSPPDQLDLLVNNIKDHHTFTGVAPLTPIPETTAHQAPGFPWLLAMLEKVPVDSTLLDPGFRWFQLGLGTLTSAFYFFFARRAFHSLLVGFLAGLLCGANPFWIANTAEIKDGVVTSFLLGLTLMLGARANQQGGPATSLLFGLALAGLAMVRAALLPFGFAAIIAFLFRCRSINRGWLYALLAFLGFGNALAPWTMRNYQAFGDIMPIADSAYYHLWMGNCPNATGGPLSQDDVREGLVTARNSTRADIYQSLTESVQNHRYSKLAPDVIHEIKKNPAKTMERRLAAGLCFLLGEKWLKDRLFWRDGPQPADGLPTWLSDLVPAMMNGAVLLMVGLGVLGWRWSYAWRWESMPFSLALIWIPLPYVLSHAESLSGPRLPLDGVLLTLAAFALACLTPTVARSLFGGSERVESTDDKT